jgi:hypothetical protein
MLRVGHNVGSGDVPEGAHILGKLPDPAAADLFLFPLAQVVRIADDSSLASSQRDVHDRAFPGHPHRECLDRVYGLVRMEPDSALAGAPGVVMLNAETLEDTHCPVVHPHGDADVVFAHRVSQELPDSRFERKHLRHPVELGLGCVERIVRFVHGISSSVLTAHDLIKISKKSVLSIYRITTADRIVKRSV